MSSPEDRDAERVGALVERLLTDAGFRAEFRRDPVMVSSEFGLSDLAGDLGTAGRGIETLEMRESKSSLAGVVMALAAEGVAFDELRNVVEHGLGSGGHHGLGRGVHGLRTPRQLAALKHQLRVPRSLTALRHQVEHSVTKVERSAAAGGSPASASATPAAGSASATSSAPAAGSAPATSSAPAAGAAPAAGSGASTPITTAAVAPAAGAGHASPLPWPDQSSGAGPATGTGSLSTTGGVAEPGAGPGAGSASVINAAAGTLPAADPSAVLASPDLTATPAVKAWLASGQADPRAVSMLQSVLSHHQIVLGNVQVLTAPAPVQELVITSVDGQPVSADNFAARDLVTELAAMDPSTRPDDLGTPWPIQSPGFSTGTTSANSLNLSFGAAGTNTPSAAGLAGAVAGQPAAGAAAAPTAVPAQVPDVVPAVHFGDTSSAVPEKAQAALDAAKKELGVPYLWGGTTPGGFDCSGLMQWAYHQVGVDLPRVAADQATVGTPVSLKDLRPGDLVYFRIGGGEVDHIGMYVGDHQFLEAPRTGENVQYANLDDSYWKQWFAGARRIVPGDAGLHAAGAASDLRVNGPSPSVLSAEAGASTAPPAPASTTAAFVAAGSPGASPRATVQFLQAVQPAPAATSVSISTDMTSSAMSGQTSPAGTGQALGATPEQPGSVVEQIGSQAAGTGVGDVISVTASSLTSGQETFAAKVASLTGLSPRVVAAWALAEESGGAAQARQAASNFNWLNIGYFDSGAGKIAFDRAFSDPVTAAEQTAKFLKGDWGGASSSIRAILNSAGASSEQQISAIANSDWASSHYYGGSSLRGTYAELGDMQVTTT